jgi:hypothetical protein
MDRNVWRDGFFSAQNDVPITANPHDMWADNSDPDRDDYMTWAAGWLTGNAEKLQEERSDEL